MHKLIAPEPESLLEVRRWKEEVYQETKDFTAQQYLQHVALIAQQIKAKYHLSLQEVNLSSGSDAIKSPEDATRL